MKTNNLIIRNDARFQHLLIVGNLSAGFERNSYGNAVVLNARTAALVSRIEVKEGATSSTTRLNKGDFPLHN
jgi:hypothetical protein